MRTSTANTIRIFAWGGAAGLLVLPLLFNFPWTLSDYIVAGCMLGGAGLVLELLLRMSGSLVYRAGAVLAVLGCVLLFWVNGAVGFLGDEGNPANLLFLGVIAIVVLGSVMAGFRAGGMALALFAAAAAQVAIGVAAVALRLGSPGYAGLYEAVMGTGLFSSIWLVSGGLFLKAARDEPRSAAGI